jgi:hypothetical protein
VPGKRKKYRRNDGTDIVVRKTFSHIFNYVLCSIYHIPQDKLKLYPATLRPNPVQDLDATVYAQIRTLHFLKWNKTAPEALLKECGPHAHAYAMGVRTPMILPTHVKVRKRKNSYFLLLFL